MMIKDHNHYRPTEFDLRSSKIKYSFPLTYTKQHMVLESDNYRSLYYNCEFEPERTLLKYGGRRSISESINLINFSGKANTLSGAHNETYAEYHSKMMYMNYLKWVKPVLTRSKMHGYIK